MHLETFVWLSPVVLGLVQALKMAGLPTKYAPVTAVIIGVLAVGFMTVPTATTVIGGLVAGLGAVGLWSGVKTTLR